MTDNPDTRPPSVTFLAAKNGQGTTVTATAYAALHAEAGQRTLLIDAAPNPDCATVLGLADHDPARIVTVTANLDLTHDPSMIAGDANRADYDLVVIDAGTNPTSTRGLTVLVTRACYLSIRRAVTLPQRSDATVLIDEPGRALKPDDVAAVLNQPVTATIPFDPSIARSIDSGLLAAWIPRALQPLHRLDHLTQPTSTRR